MLITYDEFREFIIKIIDCKVRTAYLQNIYIEDIDILEEYDETADTLIELLEIIMNDSNGLITMWINSFNGNEGKLLIAHREENNEEVKIVLRTVKDLWNILKSFNGYNLNTGRRDKGLTYKS